MPPIGKARCLLLCVVPLGFALGAWSLNDELRAAPATPRMAPALVGEADAPHPLPEGRQMEAVGDALAEASTLAPGTELLVGPGRMSCHRDLLCVLRDEFDPYTFLVFSIASLTNGQRDYLVDNPALASGSVAARLVRIAHGDAPYQALQVIDARTRETIGQQ